MKVMKARIAVATVSGKAYYLIVNELRRYSVPFISLTPFDPIPMEVRVVITTKKEKPLINHERVLALEEADDPLILISQALQYAEGKNSYEKVVIGIDPGEISGLAILADGRIIGAENCFSMEETLRKVDDVVKKFKNINASAIIVKVGDGIPKYKEQILHALDKILPKDVILESVHEAGTSSNLREFKHRRGLRDIASAIRIAKRDGDKFVRG